MSGESYGTRLLNAQLPPRAGQISAFALSTTAGSQSLAALGNQAPKTLGVPGGSKRGAAGFYVSFQADGTDAFLNFGPTLASVTGANAPAAATVGVNAAAACAKVPNGTTLRIMPQLGTDAFFGFVGSAAGTLRVWVSSIDS